MQGSHTLERMEHVGDDLENEVGTCRLAGDLDVLRLDSSRHKMLYRYYGLLERCREGSGWHKRCGQYICKYIRFELKKYGAYCN